MFLSVPLRLAAVNEKTPDPFILLQQSSPVFVDDSNHDSLAPR